MIAMLKRGGKCSSVFSKKERGCVKKGEMSVWGVSSSTERHSQPLLLIIYIQSNQHGLASSLRRGSSSSRRLSSSSWVLLEKLAIRSSSLPEALPIGALEELNDYLSHHLARELDDKVEEHGEGKSDDKQDEPRDAENGRGAGSRVVHREGDVGNNGEGDGGSEEEQSSGEFAEGAHDNVAENVLRQSRSFNREEPERGKDGVAEGELGVRLNVDGGHARVDVVAQDGHPLEHEGEHNEHGVEREALPCRPPRADVVEVSVSVHVGNDESEDGGLLESTKVRSARSTPEFVSNSRRSSCKWSRRRRRGYRKPSSGSTRDFRASCG